MSYIYFIANGQSQVKIGVSVNPKIRLAALQANSPNDTLEFIRIIPGGAKTELWLHRRYAKYRIVGEWFQFIEEMMTVVVPDEIPDRKASNNLHLLEPNRTPEEKEERIIRYLKNARKLGLLK